MKLEAASLTPPPGVEELLADIGDGENGFGGNPVHDGGMTLQDYLKDCCDGSDPDRTRPGLVPQTVFWVLDDSGTAVGMVRMRHCLNERLRFEGGHIGFFIRSDSRGRGYAREALRLTLLEIRKLGEERILLTADLDNTPSIRVIEANGGGLKDTDVDPDSGKEFGRYWIDLGSRRG